jgi:hypothetical protein
VKFARANFSQEKKMKRLIQISIVLILALILIVGLIQFTEGNALARGGNVCRVGWNSRTDACLASGKDACRVGWNSRTGSCLASTNNGHKNFDIQPFVGWNI